MTPANRTRSGADQLVFAAGTYKLLALAVGTIGAFGFCNNALVLLLYCRFKRLRTPTNLLLVNISLSDFLVSLLGVNLTFASCVRGRWMWSQAACVWDGFCNSLFGLGSQHHADASSDLLITHPHLISKCEQAVPTAPMAFPPAAPEDG